MYAPDWDALLAELGNVLRGVCPDAFMRAVERLAAARRVYVGGLGRSGHLARMFATRLMHAGLAAHVLGDATTPAMAPGDVAVFVSGSGRTASLLALSEKVARAGGTWLAVTYAPESPLAEGAAAVLCLPVPRDPARPGGVGGSQWMGNLFDQAALVALDQLAIAVGRRRGETEADAQRRHANIE